MGGSSTNPQIGDVRVTITKTEPCDISILAKVNGNTFEKYVAKNGKTVSRVAQGTVGAETMFADAHSENSMMTWMLRLVGVLMVIGGLRAMFSIVETLFKVLPFLANIVGAGVGLIVAVAGIQAGNSDSAIGCFRRADFLPNQAREGEKSRTCRCLSISHLNSGVYILKLRTAKDTGTYKVVKE